MKTDNKTSWITNKSETEGDVRLFCFPSAGGGSVTYYPWREVLRPEIELLLVHLPGREQRLREPLITDFTVLVKKLADELFKDVGECRSSKEFRDYLLELQDHRKSKFQI